ncbi:hypothetical protein BpHYR1_037023 [Brachionus plicatilis]|uniref:Transmembrane protein n=1 Tax=Brachionus plicatilis TaxID=10195 RepID=A0A3M7SMS5_BRAPC|nr:hypothetical protein BpHYR1_037023 [Brachionus plicatilis]
MNNDKSRLYIFNLLSLIKRKLFEFLSEPQRFHRSRHLKSFHRTHLHSLHHQIHQSFDFRITNPLKSLKAFSFDLFLFGLYLFKFLIDIQSFDIYDFSLLREVWIIKTISHIFQKYVQFVLKHNNQIVPRLTVYYEFFSLSVSITSCIICSSNGSLYILRINKITLNNYFNQSLFILIFDYFTILKCKS